MKKNRHGNWGQEKKKRNKWEVRKERKEEAVQGKMEIHNRIIKKSRIIIHRENRARERENVEKANKGRSRQNGRGGVGK